MKIETERKFLLKRLPDLSSVKTDVQHITHYYQDASKRLSLYVGANGNRYDFVEKSTDSGMSRTEKVTSDLIESNSKAWINSMAKKTISKTRHTFHYQNQKWEIDLFDKTGMVMAECEIVSENQQQAEDSISKIQIPPFIEDIMIREVTDDSRFRNYALAEPF